MAQTIQETEALTVAMLAGHLVIAQSPAARQYYMAYKKLETATTVVERTAESDVLEVQDLVKVGMFFGLGKLSVCVLLPRCKRDAESCTICAILCTWFMWYVCMCVRVCTLSSYLENACCGQGRTWVKKQAEEVCMPNQVWWVGEGRGDGMSGGTGLSGSGNGRRTLGDTESEEVGGVLRRGPDTHRRTRASSRVS